uniref:Uncharacterized protein n=1 Tax=Brassica oleracea var. oleracea TaxID=109376 RepID=A0A0D3BT16_BRAOL
MERPRLIPKGEVQSTDRPSLRAFKWALKHRPIFVLRDQDNCDLVSRGGWIEPETCWRLSPVSLPLDHNHPIRPTNYYWNVTVLEGGGGGLREETAENKLCLADVEVELLEKQNLLIETGESRLLRLRQHQIGHLSFTSASDIFFSAKASFHFVTST